MSISFQFMTTTWKGVHIVQVARRRKIIQSLPDFLCTQCTLTFFQQLVIVTFTSEISVTKKNVQCVPRFIFEYH